MKTQFQLKGHYYHNQFHPFQNSAQASKHCPVNDQQVLWQASFEDSISDQVIQSAQQGYETWRKTSLEQRIQALVRYQKELEKNQDDIAMALALEVGKPLWEAKTEAAALISKVQVTIEESGKRVQDYTIKNIMNSVDGHVLYRPLGICVVIGPFNFPCHLANGQILSALLTGNSIIFKPSEKTLYAPQLMMECFARAGFPQGVINFAVGGAKLAHELCTHPLTKGVFFTGSKQVGLKIMQATHQRLDQLVALELGGKNTTIIHSDASLEHAMAETLKASYLTTGQRCTSTGIIAVQRKIYDQFKHQFTQLVEKIIVDHPCDFSAQPFMSSLIDEAAVNHYFEYCQKAEEQGAEILLPAKKLEITHGGHYVSAALHSLGQVKDEHSFLKDEIFGPQCTLVAYDDIEEAIQISNQSEFGLAASVFTKEKKIYQQCLTEIEAGIINLNRSTVGASSKLPFGGLKNSGNFRPAGVTMIDHCVHPIASLETTDDQSSQIAQIPGLKT